MLPVWVVVVERGSRAAGESEIVSQLVKPEHKNNNKANQRETPPPHCTHTLSLSLGGYPNHHRLLKYETLCRYALCALCEAAHGERRTKPQPAPNFLATPSSSLALPTSRAPTLPHTRCTFQSLPFPRWSCTHCLPLTHDGSEPGGRCIPWKKATPHWLLLRTCPTHTY